MGIKNLTDLKIKILIDSSKKNIEKREFFASPLVKN